MLPVFIGVNLHLQLDLPLEPTHQWQPLIDTSGDAEVFRERYGEATQANVIEFWLWTRTTPTRSSPACGRRGRMPLGAGDDFLGDVGTGKPCTCICSHRPTAGGRGIVRAAARFPHWLPPVSGHHRCHHEPQRGLAFHAPRGSLERADKISRILDVKYFILLPSATFVGTPYDDLHWSAVLKSVSGFEMYRKRHGRITPREIVEFLVIDNEFPRAIHYCLRRADESLHAITGTPTGDFRGPSEQALEMLRAKLGFISVDKVIAEDCTSSGE